MSGYCGTLDTPEMPMTAEYPPVNTSTTLNKFSAAVVPASAAQWLVQVLEEDGISRADLLADTCLGHDWPGHPDATLTAYQYEKLVTNALAASGDPALGISVSRQMNFLSRNGFWGYAVMSCTTLGDAVDTAIRYWPLTGSLMHVHKIQTEHMTKVTVTPAFAFVQGEIWRFAVEKFLFSTLLSLGWMVDRTAAFETVWLSYSAPTHAQRYQESLGCPVQFGAPDDAVLLNHDALQWPLVTSQPQLTQMCRERCTQAMLRLQGNDTFIASIQEFIWANIQGPLTLDQIASHLGTTSRTLRRRLQERGSSFQRILDGVRETVARDYLVNTVLSIDQIASLIGFSEPTTFRSTFKRWTGQSAAELRRLHKP
jgi:AraC-like DNA-binding protein